MNDQPYGIPPSHWPPKLTPWWFRMTRFLRHRALSKQKMTDVTLEGTDYLARAIDAGYGVMLTPNHSFHWDSYCLLRVAERISTPFYIMSAWQVFAASSWFECESMQRCGCFSVDREGNDIQSLKTAVDILQSKRHPLVIFPEGDIYHTNDRVTPFRDGAAAMALMAARKSQRPIAIIPVAIKRWYTEDPTPSLLQVLEKIEQRMHWQPRRDLALQDRIVNLAEGLLGLKEAEYRKDSPTGSLSHRIASLMDWILQQAEAKYALVPKTTFAPDRIKEVRRTIIALQEQHSTTASKDQRDDWNRDMHSMFLATQLYSYPGDYLLESPTVERLAETVDKLEEDTLGVPYPTLHGAKRVTVRLAPPILMPAGKEKKVAPAETTDQVESQVQTMLDELNRDANQRSA